MYYQLITILLVVTLIPEFSVRTVQGEEARESELIDVSKRLERSFEQSRNGSLRPNIIHNGIGKVERDIIISVLVVACVTPLLCGILMVACQLATQMKKKHIRKFCKKQGLARRDCNQSEGISKMGPLQLHNSFPVYINGLTREEMECYMNLTALAREQGMRANGSIGTNNPETGQIEGKESVPLTPPHIRIKPRIAIVYPSPTPSYVNTNGVFSPTERNTRNLYPPLPYNFRNDAPIFEMQPKNSTPRSPLSTPPQAKHRPSIRETPDRAVKKKKIDLLRQMTMSPPPSYTSKEVIKSMPCLSFPYKGSPCSNLNVSKSSVVKQKDRSASESDLST